MSDPQNATVVSQFPATDLIFRTNSYQTKANARVIGVVGNALVLDRSLFYAASGGQPSDHGDLTRSDGLTLNLIEMRYLDAAKSRIAHVLPEGASPEEWIGAEVTLSLDFSRRLKLMRMHSALHLLSVVLPFSVTGGAVNPDDGRLDFDIPEGGLDKDEITKALNALIAHNADIRDRLITDDELDANPGLVKTMSVKPPRGTGTIRLVEIEGLDVQPCGGTHVRNTREIGPMQVTSIEKKGKLNRRVRIAFA